MNTAFLLTDFCHELKTALPESTAAQRKLWAAKILEQQLNLKDLAPLLEAPRTVATRFLWLLSELGTLNPEWLHQELPHLLALSQQLELPEAQTALATWWQIAGVPEANEAQAIDLLFGWLRSATTTATIKSRALMVLEKLAIKHPDLRNELQHCLHEEVQRNGSSFEKRALKTIATLQHD